LEQDLKSNQTKTYDTRKYESLGIQKEPNRDTSDSLLAELLLEESEKKTKKSNQVKSYLYQFDQKKRAVQDNFGDLNSAQN